jgi:hypothetical protein
MAKKATSKPNSGFSNSLMNSGGSSSLSTRAATRAGGVRKQGESQDQMQQRLGSYGEPSGSDNSAIDAVFKGIQGIRRMVRRGLSGQPLNPDGTDPGNSFDRFMSQNPHLQGAAGRQAQYDQQARADMPDHLRSAVNERKALQEMQQPNPNLVTGNDGYRTLFGQGGKVIGTTKPMARTSDNAINRGTATGAERGQFSQQLQQTGMSSASSPKGLDMLFPGNAKSSPPGGANAGRVGPPQAPGEPGGDTLFGQMPEYKSPGMPRWDAVPEFSLGSDQSKLSIPGVTEPYLPGSSTSLMAGPNKGPQLPVLSSEQLTSLKALDARGFPARQRNEIPQAPSRFSMGLQDYFPGNDYDYLQQLFPGMSIDQILQLIPNFASQID